jgi:acyl-coenzyme A thioesterase PaaI-like protein
MSKLAFQDQMGGNHCWGCGSLNPQGLHIKSYWSGEESECIWQPRQQHMAGPQHILNGGIIATLIDCHSVCTAIADAYRVEHREIGSEPMIWYATASLQIGYLRPTPIGEPVKLRAQIATRTDQKTVLTCTLTSNGKECVAGEVVAVWVPLEWREAA